MKRFLKTWDIGIKKSMILSMSIEAIATLIIVMIVIWNKNLPTGIPQIFLHIPILLISIASIPIFFDFLNSKMEHRDYKIWSQIIENKRTFFIKRYFYFSLITFLLSSFTILILIINDSTLINLKEIFMLPFIFFMVPWVNLWIVLLINRVWSKLNTKPKTLMKIYLFFVLISFTISYYPYFIDDNVLNSVILGILFPWISLASVYQNLFHQFNIIFYFPFIIHILLSGLLLWEQA